MLRCCAGNRFHLRPSYASVLATGATSESEHLEQVVKLEQQGIVPCVTGWCNQHHRVALILPLDLSLSPSDYLGHILTMSNQYLKSDIPQ